MKVIKRYWWDLNSSNPRNVDLWWEFLDTKTSDRYEVWVERSSSISGPFILLAKTYNSIYYWDQTAYLSVDNIYVYRLKVFDRVSQEIIEITDPLVVEKLGDIVSEEIRYRADILTRSFSGLPVLYYPLRIPEETKCPDCWDSETGHRIKSKCDTCYDTGFLIGYYNPILTYMRISEDPTGVSQSAELDEFYVRTATGLLSGNHIVRIGDLILESTTDRWVVSSYSVTEHLRSHTSYTVRLHHLQESDIRSTIPLPESVSLTKLIHSDVHRNKHPMTLDP